VKIRILNDDGMARFKEFIDSLRSGADQNTPAYLLTSDEYSIECELAIEIDADRVFDSRYEMGKYLADLFSSHNIGSVIGTQGFWSWIALLWFDQLCPIVAGKRKPSKDYNYILSRRYNHRPRHAIYMTWQLVDRYGSDSQFMLCKPMTMRGEITEQMMARQEILSSDGAVQLASRLYYDPASGGFKRGAAARKSAGCIARYISWLQQLQVTFDIFSTSANDLEDLLPREFSRFQQVA